MKKGKCQERATDLEEFIERTENGKEMGNGINNNEQ